MFLNEISGRTCYFRYFKIKPVEISEKKNQNFKIRKQLNTEKVIKSNNFNAGKKIGEQNYKLTVEISK